MTTARDTSISEVDPACRQFFLWALSVLHLPTENLENGVFQCTVPSGRQSDFDGQEVLRFTFETIDPAVASGPTQLSLSSPLGKQILGSLKQLGDLAHAVPQGQTVSVSELTSRLFEAYTVENGSVRLGGCRLEDRPLLRYTYVIGSGTSPSAARLAHVYASPDRRPIDDSLLSALGARELAPLDDRPPRVQDADALRWLDFGKQHAPVVADGEQADLLLVTVVWCKYAQGKLRFAIGDSRVETDFHGWARLLVDGTISPPPFRCPETGQQSYHLVAIEDGRITVPGVITVCEESGRRVLTSDLEACNITGRCVLPDLLQTCPVSDERLLPSAMVSCSQCLQAVSPHCIRGGRCRACRSLESVLRDDPRIARVLGEYEGLDHWSRWRMAETATSYILTASALIRRMLVVLDKESLEVTRLAEGTRFSKNWSEVPEEQRREYVG